MRRTASAAKRTITGLPTRRLLALLLALMTLAGCGDAGGREAEVDIRPADTSSPHATLRTFLDSCNRIWRLTRQEKYFDRDSPEHYAMARRVLDCFDTSELPSHSREDIASEAAVYIKEILDRIDLPPESEIPDHEAIEAAGGPEKLSRWQIPGARITIARVEEGPRRHEYLFSPGTIERAPKYFESMKSAPYREAGEPTSPGFYDWFFAAPTRRWVGEIVTRLPGWTRERWYGVTNWKGIALLLTLPIALGLMGVAFYLGRRLAARWRDTNLLLYCLTLLLPIAATLVPPLYSQFARSELTLRGQPLYVLQFSASLIAMLSGLVVVFGGFTRLAEVVIASPRIQPQGLDAQFIRICARLLSLFAIVVLFLEGGKYLGIPITTLLASAGVGGLTIALAAQGTMRGLFGTITILLDKPYRVGERIIVRDYDGCVEEIGLRSTKIRTFLTGHLVSIPNDQMADSEIENVGRRPFLRRTVDLQIPLDTPRAKLDQAVAIIRAALDNHEGMDPEYPPRVYFSEFNRDSFNIRFIYWFYRNDYWEFMEFNHRLNLEIFRKFEEHGIQFSLPRRLVHTSLESVEKPFEVQFVDKPAPNERDRRPATGCRISKFTRESGEAARPRRPVVLQSPPRLPNLRCPASRAPAGGPCHNSRPMPNPLRFVLLQVRNSDDPMRRHEVVSFARALDVAESQIGVIDLLGETPERRVWKEFDAVLLGGSGHYSVAGSGPWLDRALDTLREVHGLELPTFASCWGFQAMARALGGRVVKDLDRAEVGTHLVWLTEAGKRDPVFGPLGNEFFAQMGHEDCVTELPPGTTLLATNARNPYQAYRFDDAPIYCTQFHPELRGEDLYERVRVYPEYIYNIEGITIEEFCTRVRESPQTEQLLGRFLEHVGLR